MANIQNTLQESTLVRPHIHEMENLHQQFSHIGASPTIQSLLFTSNEMSHQQPVASTSSSSMNSSIGFNILAGPSDQSQAQKRRSSSRSIKRKKFDDELVESSLKSSRPRPPSTTFPMMTPTNTFPVILPPTHPLLVTRTSELPLPEASLPIIAEKRKSRPPPKRAKKSKNSQQHSTKDIGRWKPADDLALILAVQQTNDLECVYRAVKFSCKLTVQEIQERWYALLYDSTISKVAHNAMKQLHPDIISQIQARSLFGEEEEKLVASIPSTIQATTEMFQELLEKHPDVFLLSRTPEILLSHWTLMKHYNLLPDQTAPKLHQGEYVVNFSDAEEIIDDSELNEARDEDIDKEMRISNRFAKRHIKLLENELPKWQVLVDSITGVTPPDFDSQTLAVLKGRFVRYLMRSQEITIGRAAKDNMVDIDLSLEGPAWKVSRKQGMIKLENNGDFVLVNEGRRPFYVDGKPVLIGSKFKLTNNSVVEIIGLRFIFLVNQDLINSMKAKNSS